MKKVKRNFVIGLILISIFLILFLLMRLHESDSDKKPVEDVATSNEPKETIEYTDNYIQKNRDLVLDAIIEDGMTDYEKVKAVYDYVATVSTFEEPIGLESWIIYGESTDMEPTYLEKRATSILLYGFGYCEEYAATIYILLDELDIPVRYVEGLGLSRGRYMDHAWNMVQLDGNWYHLDCTYDDSIAFTDTLQYTYFLKGATSFSVDHIWGDILLSSGMLSDEQNNYIRDNYLFEVNIEDYPITAPMRINPTRNNKEQLIERISMDRGVYESEHGEIVRESYFASSPVFGIEGINRP